MSPLLYQLSYTAAAAKLTAYGGRVKRSRGECAQIVPASQFARRISQIAGADDVVAIENAPGSISGESHADDFGDAQPDEISRRRSPQIVPQFANQPGSPTGHHDRAFVWLAHAIGGADLGVESSRCECRHAAPQSRGTKIGDGRIVYLTAELTTMIEEQIERVRALSRTLGRVIPYLFPHLEGRFQGEVIRDFRKSWASACKAVGGSRRRN